MQSQFLTTKTWIGLSASYFYDDQLEFASTPVYVDGKLSYVTSKVFENSNDFANNNYTFFSLSKKKPVSQITDFDAPKGNDKLLMGTFKIIDENFNRNLFFTSFVDEVIYSDISVYDSIFIELSGIIDSNFFFEVDFNDPVYATVSHLYNGEKYYLATNPASLNLNFVANSAFDVFNDYSRKFTYAYDNKNNILILQQRINGVPYLVGCNKDIGRLVLSAATLSNFLSATTHLVFETFKSPEFPEVTNDVVSYLKTFNQNNIDIDSERTQFNTENNILLHFEYSNRVNKALEANFLTLKNQLNLKNNQGKGNIFLNETPTDFRDYTTIQAGGSQEQGFNKLHLGYETYSSQFTFPQSKTTWFHMPLDNYPFKKLNINDSKLVELGAVGGDHPLRSDKVWKKMADYQYTSNQGNPYGEQTGKWLCSWLSGGNSISARPVWVDRYYNPNITTPFKALTAEPLSIIYINTEDCLNLPEGVVDIESGFTFDPGALYAYSRFGKTDVNQCIKALGKWQLSKNFDSYQNLNGNILIPEKNDGIDTFKFNGNSYGTVNVSNFNLSSNVFCISFWMNRNDWTTPCGFEILGNMTDFGLGMFNYNLVTPFTTLLSGGNLQVVNQNLNVIGNLVSNVSAWGRCRFLLRRDPLNSLQVVTDKNYVIEFDWRGSVLDLSTALRPVTADNDPFFDTDIKDVFNDLKYAYVLYDNNDVDIYDLFSKTVSVTSYDAVIGNINTAKEIRRLFDGRIVLIDGTNTYIDTASKRVYYINNGNVNVWYCDTYKISSFISDKFNRITSFNVDTKNNSWVGRQDGSVSIYGQFSENLLNFTLTAGSEFSTTPLSCTNICFSTNFNAGELETTALISASGSQQNKLVLFKTSLSGEILNTTLVETGGRYFSNIDPTNSNFNNFVFRDVYPDKSYNFRVKLYNVYNKEDVIEPEIILDSADLNPGYHHFTIKLNTEKGIFELYLDGELYETSVFTQNTYNFIPLLVDAITVGSTPFYNGQLLSSFLYGRGSNTAFYFAKDLEVQDFYIHKKDLNYHDIGVLYKAKIVPDDLKWDVPSGRRSYLDVVSRYFYQKVPGMKSMLYNIYINNASFNQEGQNLLNALIVNKLKEISPAYSKVNKIEWLNTNTQLSPVANNYNQNNILTSMVGLDII